MLMRRDFFDDLIIHKERWINRLIDFTWIRRDSVFVVLKRLQANVSPFHYFILDPCLKVPLPYFQQ